MSIKLKFVSFLENLLKALKEKEENNFLHDVSTEDIEDTNFEEVKIMAHNLNNKVTILSDKIIQINEKLSAMTILQEEILYSFEQNEQTEENHPKLIQTEEKKFGIN